MGQIPRPGLWWFCRRLSISRQRRVARHFPLCTRCMCPIAVQEMDLVHVAETPRGNSTCHARPGPTVMSGQVKVLHYGARTGSCWRQRRRVRLEPRKKPGQPSRGSLCKKKKNGTTVLSGQDCREAGNGPVERDHTIRSLPGWHWLPSVTDLVLFVRLPLLLLAIPYTSTTSRFLQV